MADKPIIGITLDWEAEGTFSTRPHYALRQAYFEYVENAGGVPIGIPYNENLRQAYLDIIDGVIIPGGTIAKPLEWYEEGTETLPYGDSPRLASDIAYVKLILKQKIPFLGICEGMQVLAGVLGCKLTASVHTAFNTSINHAQGDTLEKPAHSVSITPGTLLAAILGEVESIEVNSSHLEGVKSLSDRAVLSARAPDGVIEAFEVTDHPFAMGIEWHPEFASKHGSSDHKILRAFIAAAQRQKKKS